MQCGWLSAKVLLWKRYGASPDGAPPVKAPSAPPRQVSSGSAPPFAVFCYLIATVAFIAALALVCRLIPPISAEITMILWVVVPGILLLIAGALFHIIKLLKVMVRTGTDLAAPGLRHGSDSGPSQ